jgi:hypothetical protein
MDAVAVEDFAQAAKLRDECKVASCAAASPLTKGIPRTRACVAGARDADAPCAAVPVPHRGAVAHPQHQHRGQTGSNSFAGYAMPCQAGCWHAALHIACPCRIMMHITTVASHSNAPVTTMVPCCLEHLPACAPWDLLLLPRTPQKARIATPIH